jgi:hypothetical protein
VTAGFSRALKRKTRLSIMDKRVFQYKGDAEAPPADRQAGHVRELEEEERSSGLFTV